VDNLSTKLLNQYEAVRRQEHEQITELLDVLGQVDGLPESEMEQARDALFHANHPFLMVMTGPFSSGKSSIINALLGENVMDVGPIPTTDHIVILRHGAELQRTRAGEIETIFHPSHLLENLSLVDTPGLESVFRTHEALTRRFLHRADVVVLVMLATQVLTAGNLEYLQELKVYGKRVVVLVNQVDVLEPSEREQVREFVFEQSRQYLGLEPKIWLVSARQAMAAQQETPRDEIQWDESGFADFEEYIKLTLNDAERYRQKLETPIQIVQNVTKTALGLVQLRQSSLDEQRKTVQNIDAQIEQGRRAQQQTVDDTLHEIENQWNETAARGSEAISELFQFSRGFSLFFRGLGEIVGIGRLFRRFRRQTQTENTFEQHKVIETLRQIPQTVDKLGPRLEGRDLQDIDDLVDYTRKAVDALPSGLSDKVIGHIQTPLRYERGFLRDVSSQLDDLTREAERFETKRLDRILRNTLIILALWELLIICLLVSVAANAFSNVVSGTQQFLVVFGVGFVLVIFGLGLVPLRGWFLSRAYERRLAHLRDKHLEILRRASEDAVKHGVQLRRDAVAPFTRMVEAQTEMIGKLRGDLLDQQQALLRIQSGLAAMHPPSES